MCSFPDRVTDNRSIRDSRISIPNFLYVQIAESLLDWIESERLPPNTRLPPERELGARLGVTRATVRQALNVLDDRGLIYRRQGQGTFIAIPKIERQAGKLVPFTKSMERRGYKTEARLISLEKFPADASVAEGLNLPIGKPTYFLHRVRIVSHEPVLLERIFVPAMVFPELERFDLAKRSLYEVMETEYGVTVVRARQSLEPVTATEYEAELLEAREGAPLMLERRIAYDEQDRPVERARDLFRGDRFRFITEMAPIEI